MPGHSCGLSAESLIRLSRQQDVVINIRSTLLTLIVLLLPDLPLCLFQRWNRRGQHPHRIRAKALFEIFQCFIQDSNSISLLRIYQADSILEIILFHVKRKQLNTTSRRGGGMEVNQWIFFLWKIAWEVVKAEANSESIHQ